MEAKKIFFVRHGHYIQTKAGQDNSECELSIKGIEEINRLSKRLLDEQIEAIYTSPYLRTLQTAHILAKLLKVKVTTDKRLVQDLNKNNIKSSFAVHKRMHDAVSDILKLHNNAVVVSHEYPISLYISKERNVTFPQMIADYSHLRLIEQGECLIARYESGLLETVRHY